MPTWSQGCAHSQCDLPPTQQWKLAAAVVCSPVGPAPYWTSGTQPPFAPRHTCISLLLPKEPVGTRLSTGSPEAGAPLPVLGAGLGFRAPGTGSLRPGDPWAGASALAPLLTAAAFSAASRCPGVVLVPSQHGHSAECGGWGGSRCGPAGRGQPPRANLCPQLPASEALH